MDKNQNIEKILNNLRCKKNVNSIFWERKNIKMDNSAFWKLQKIRNINLTVGVKLLPPPRFDMSKKFSWNHGGGGDPK